MSKGAPRDSNKRVKGGEDVRETLVLGGDVRREGVKDSRYLPSHHTHALVHVTAPKVGSVTEDD